MKPLNIPLISVNGSSQVLEAPLSEWIEVRRRFARSVHLERDLHTLNSPPQVLGGEGDALDGYRWTPSAQETLERIAHSLESPRERAITLVGPYGSGKSALSVLLCALVQGQPRAVEIVREHAPELAQALGAPDHRLLAVPLVGSRAPLAPDFVRALFAALRRADEHREESGIAWKYLPRQVEATLRQEFADLMPCLDEATSADIAPRRVADLMSRAAQEVRRAGGSGLLIVADEAGKWLEYAALHPQRTDILLLQEVAEACARSGSGEDAGALWTVLVLHQGAQDYARGLGRTAQAEWRKVAERFREVAFQPSDAERIEIVSGALEHRPPLLERLEREPLLAALREDCGELLPQSLRAAWSDWARHAYPLHPLALACLPLLFRKSGQSHRSAFNFLASREPGALSDFLSRHSFDASQPSFPLLGLDALFDYASQVLAPSWNSSSGRSWSLAQETVQSARELDDATRRTLKIVALLDVLRGPSLPASTQVLALALRDASTNAEQAELMARRTLQVLEDKCLLMRSRLRGAYRLWDGGDVDVEAELEEARATLSGSLSLSLARDVCPPPRLVARRHALETGTTRHFEPRVCNVAQLEKFVDDKSDALTLAFCLSHDRDELKRALGAAARSLGPNVLIGVALESSALREASHESAACREVSKKSDALRGDSAARREIARRDAEARADFKREWNAVFGNVLPGAAFAESSDGEPGAVRWFCAGQQIPLHGSRDLSQWLSHMADATFPKSPRVRNELINRHSLSSSAAAGRRSLIEAMWTRGDKKRLGIADTSFPPEAAMYESLLHAPKIHRQNADGAWEWGAPTGSDTARLRPLWDAMDTAIFDPVRVKKALPIRELWDTLSARPYGATEGILPPLLCAFVLAHRSDIALFKEGTFLFDAGVEDWEVMLRAPQYFAIAGVRSEDTRESVRALAELLDCEPLPLPTVSALLRRTEPFNQWSRQTRDLNGLARPLRQALLDAKMPHALLLHDLPHALGIPINEPQVLADALARALDEWGAAYPRMLRRLRDEWLEACGLEAGARGWARWCDEALELRPRLLQGELAPLMARTTLWLGDDGSERSRDEPEASEDEGAFDGVAMFESLCSVLGKGAPKNWSDGDVDRARARISELGAMWREERARQNCRTSGAEDGASTWSLQLAFKAQEARQKLNPFDQGKADSKAKWLSGKWSVEDSPAMRRAILLAMLSELGES